MLTNNFRIAKMQKTLRWFEEDVPLLNMRVKELSAERQQSARRFAAAVIEQTRAELQMHLQQQPDDRFHTEDLPCQPPDSFSLLAETRHTIHHSRARSSHSPCTHHSQP